MKNKLLLAVSCLALSTSIHAKPLDLADAPIFVNKAVPPINLLVMGKDHKLYYEAYSDNSDLDGDSVIDVGYKPDSIDYFGYFNNNVCYTQNSSTRTPSKTNKFIPSSLATKKKCSGKWSGDFLNYLTTSRMDALRKVLYGGYRSVDTTEETVLQAAYIPRDGHSWGKEYNPAADNYNISDYAPLSDPTTGYRHLFAVTTDKDDYTAAPSLKVLTDTKFRIWEWVSKEAPVAGNACWGAQCTSKGPGRRGSGSGSDMTHYAIRVDVCPRTNASLREKNCQPYPNRGGAAVYKPTGLLHDFGVEDKMYFGLLTGSYQKNIDGGVIRNNIDSFTKEINAQTGIFTSGTNGIVNTINNLKLYGFNGNDYTGCGLLADPLDTVHNQKCHMWGNPVAEMMYEGLRYFSGASSATNKYAYTNDSSVDKELGLSQPTWQPPYRENGGYPACSAPVMTVISDITPSYDYNVPGSKWSSAVSSDPKLAAHLDVSEQVDAIWAAEGGGSQTVFIGEASGAKDYAPSPKRVSNLSTVRGLSPEEPSKNGTYYSAGIARFGALKGVSANNTTNNKLMTYAIALASPLPQIKFPTGLGGFVTVVPFGKSVEHYGISPTADFQPTLTIVDFYVQALANMDPKGTDRDLSVNDGRPYAEFRINYEDVEQGNDHDMDAIVLYTIYMNADKQLVIKLDREYEGAGIHMHMGYMVSGTSKDGIYLDVKSKGNTAYRLNTPPGRDPGYCLVTSRSGCNNLPLNATRTFTVSNKDAAELLPGPLWYAAKYGMPARDPATVEGNPDNYFLVTNALTLKDQLTKAFNDIMQKNAAVTQPAVSRAPAAPSAIQERDLYTTEFDAEKWTGRVVKSKLDLNGGDKDPVWVSKIDVSKRTVKMVNKTGSALEDFNWTNLRGRTFAGTDIRAVLSVNEQGSQDTYGDERVKYIAGDRTKEGSLFRQRSSLLGDIVNSSPVLVSGAQYVPYLADSLFGTTNYRDFAKAQAEKTPMLYVGANDGMLHGFNTESGIETFAFIPTPVLENLHLLTQKTYGVVNEGSHKFYVDGALHVSDVYLNGAWKTVLVGTLGAGGRGAFALDVTDPGNIKLMWEFTEESLGSKKDKDALSDLGYTFGSPMIMKLNSGQWVVALNNGYNSPNAETGIASLFLLDVATGKVIRKLDVKGNETNNGLSEIRAADYNGDGIVDYIYSGDIQGNLWRFDLTSEKTADFSVSYGAEPLFKTEKPITTAPNIIPHPSGKGYLIVVGTGRYLTNSDKEVRKTDKPDSLYGIWDKYTKGEATTEFNVVEKANLIRQEFFLQTVTDIGDDKKSVRQEIRLLSDNKPVWTGTKAHQGWMLDLLVKGEDNDGERVVDPMLNRGKVLFLSTRRPSIDPCESGVDGFIYGINPLTGGRADFDVFDLSGNNTVNSGDGYMYKGKLLPVSGFKAPPGGFTIAGDTLIMSSGDTMKTKQNPVDKMRESWFVIPKELAE